MLKKITLIGVLAFLGLKTYEVILVSGYHKTIYNHYPGQCRSVPNIVNGSEDMELIPGGKALITTGLRFLQGANKHYKGVVTGIYVFDFNQPQNGAHPVPINKFRDLNECNFHGISSWIDKKTETIYVFVVNHLEIESVVEIFVYDLKKNILNYQETIGSSDPNVHLLNDVVAVGPRQFYASNYLYTRSSIEMKLLLRWGSVVFFDGSESTIVDSGLFRPNGISISPDGKYIYLSHTSKREVITYIRNMDGSLKVIDRTPLYTAADNFYVDPDSGHLYTGCHPARVLLAPYMRNPKQEKAPSQVLRLHTQAGRITNISEILADNGQVISGSTVAIYRKNQLLVGTVASTLLHCDVEYLS